MAIRLSARRAIVKPLAIDVDGETLNVQYRPGAFTPEFDRSARQLETSSDPETGLGAMFCSVVASWDLEGDDGQPVPLTPESLMTVPTDILIAVLGAMRKALSPGETPAATSQGSF